MLESEGYVYSQDRFDELNDDIKRMMQDRD